ncbi:hypothetical protein EJ05DRAFT_368596 [Pseudovirgaria hyperparasitica]|uniref:C6 transcription factor n=1 Tax=Pseudovirgaria hyperparasitica TaxID=470096 RepID=A0A6A6W9S4_9PEZI|nr:uncharacterized protein EJ05DRAFT_368596 [Pseudovirgaria hyperparasitica]KAF2757851.1 hypothetical protein EJ05DRAFT_368596 [Pseudovirgaria hyperparasitica]
MVSTRNHPRQFPPPELATPSKSSPTKSPSKSSSPSDNVVVRRSASKTTGWSHTPSTLTLVWLAISLPLVSWDTGYLLMRPHTMPGGKFHWPVWAPYKLYGTVDRLYGFPGWQSNNGFVGAQAFMNLLETAAYLVYLYIVYTAGVSSHVQGTGAPDKSIVGRLAEARVLTGRAAAIAVTIGFGASVATVAKTLLYVLNDAFSGFSWTGHNDLFTLLTIYIIPNGQWLIFPVYMTYVFASELLDGLEAASTGALKKAQ